MRHEIMKDHSTTNVSFQQGEVLYYLPPFYVTLKYIKCTHAQSHWTFSLAVSLAIQSWSHCVDSMGVTSMGKKLQLNPFLCKEKKPSENLAILIQTNRQSESVLWLNCHTFGGGSTPKRLLGGLPGDSWTMRSYHWRSDSSRSAIV